MGTEPGPILIADGDTRSRLLAASTLCLAGYEVREATTGDALRQALEDPAALVILDADLPGMSGYDVCRALKMAYGDGCRSCSSRGCRRTDCIAWLAHSSAETTTF